MFICTVFVGFSQGKNYKNQINRTLTEKINLQRTVEEKQITPVTQTPKYQQKPEHADNLTAFLMHEDIPNDLRFSLHRDLIAAGGNLPGMLRSPKLAKLVLGGL